MRIAHRSRLICLLALIIAGAHPCVMRGASRPSAPRVFLLDGRALMELRRRVASEGDSSPALAALRKEAAAALDAKPLSVTDKPQTPPSGDKHDYMSLGRYWWPNPKARNGLPYIRHDGRSNPEILKYTDHRELFRLIETTHALALAYFLLGDERYAAHSAQLLRAWFLDPATCMNPNLNYSQGIRGVTPGRGTGIIDSRGLAEVVDSVGLLAGSPAWTTAEQKGMEQWFSQYLNWLETSANGKHEGAARNNHGSWYDVQFAAIALFTGKDDLARRVALDARSKRIAAQIEPDGRQPLELRRTNSLSYSTFNLTALFQLARLGECAGADLWNYQTSDGRSLRKALDFLLPYAADKSSAESGGKKWLYQQIIPYQPKAFAQLLAIASEKYKDAGYKRLALELEPGLDRHVEIMGRVNPLFELDRHHQ